MKYSRPEWYRYGSQPLTVALVHERWRDSRHFLRTVSLTVLLLFLNATLWPTWAVAAVAHQQQKQRQEMQWQAHNTTLSQVLHHLQQQIIEHRTQIDQRLQKEGGAFNDVLTFMHLSRLATVDTDHVSWLAKRANALYQQSLTDFSQTSHHLKQHHLPAAIEQRNQQALARFKQHHQKMQAKLKALLTASSLLGQQQAVNQLHQFMQGFITQKPRPKLDPKHLPWGTPNPKRTPKPATTAQQLSDATSVPLWLPSQLLASNTPMPVDQPTADDLAATPDAQQSPAIVAKAAALNNNPVAIYQWVRNHITFIPSYGSIQGADYTLQRGAGNAFDTASLLIALLRAAHVPARYALGTVRIPAQEVMNWVGNVTTPEAAGNLLGQGGIPNTLITGGGKVTAFQLEHVWVEAWINYQPSRGAKNLDGDSWVPMDASFKQYAYTQGANLQAAVPFDAQGLATTLQQQSTINTTNGWVQNVPQQPIQEALTNYQTQLNSYITNQNPDATVGDVLGTQNIKTVIHRDFASTLPYHLVTRKLATPSLPDDLRWKFTYRLSDAQDGVPPSLITITKPTVDLAGKKLTLSFKPATQADADTLQSYLPAPGPDGQIDPSQLPNELPGYLINLTGEFAIDGQTVATAADSMAMGTSLNATMGYWQPNRGWRTSKSNPIAGEYHAIGLDLQGISHTQSQTLQTNLTDTQTALTAGDYANLTKEQMVGDLLYSTIFSYFALNDVQNQLAAPQANEVSYRAPSYGEFYSSLSPQYWYGIPREVDTAGMTMDVAHLTRTAVDKSNDTQKWVAFNQAVGSRSSAMEGLVPQQLFSTATAPAQGISAVKAMALANAAGQKIWTITKNNLSTALASVQLPASVETDITNAVNAGKIVTTQSQPVAYAGGNFTGYLVIDPTTGAGGYLLGNGTNGGHTRDTSASDNLLLAASALLGATDSYTGARVPEGLRPIFSETLKKISKNGRFSKFAGYLGLVVALLLVALNPSFSVSDKIGQASVDILGFAAITLLIELLVGATLISLFGVISLSIFIAIAVSMVVNYINSEFFSYIFKNIYSIRGYVYA